MTKERERAAAAAAGGEPSSPGFQEGKSSERERLQCVVEMKEENVGGNYTTHMLYCCFLFPYFIFLLFYCRCFLPQFCYCR
jgi:hypothetical protein